MPERKAWTNEQDRILRLLKDERGEKKWSSIAKMMDNEYGIRGRTGKQCRERYHNHLDSSIVSAEWTKGQEYLLYENHELVGNKWSIIAQHLPGRSDNCVKNHFYSKLRKSIRKLNKIISQRFEAEFHEIKISLLNKIIQTTEEKFKLNSKVNEDVVNDCNSIKNQLFRLDQCNYCEQQNQKNEQKLRRLIESIHKYENRLKKANKSFKKHKVSMETNASPTELPENNDQSMKKQENELSFYRIIKKICEEIIVSKDQ